MKLLHPLDDGKRRVEMELRHKKTGTIWKRCFIQSSINNPSSHHQVLIAQSSHINRDPLLESPNCSLFRVLTYYDILIYC